MALASAALGCGAMAGAFWRKLDRLTELTPLVLVGALIVLALAGVIRAGRIVCAMALLAVLPPAVLMAPDLLAAAGDLAAGLHPPQGEVRVKVLTANIWNENQNTAAFLKLLRDEAPDIVVVQELVDPWNDLLVSLAPDYKIISPSPFTPFCDVAVLSRLRPLAPSPADRARGRSPERGTIRIARLALPGNAGAFTMMGVHAPRPPGDGARIEDLADIAVEAARLGSRGILAGDFNAPPWSKALRTFDQAVPLRRGTHMLFSWPASARRFTPWRLWVPPFAPIDHIYAGRDWRLLEAHVGDAIGSDHAPVIATFVLSPGAGGEGSAFPRDKSSNAASP